MNRKTTYSLIVAIMAIVASTGTRAQSIEVEKADLFCGDVEYKKPVTAEFKLRNAGTRKLLIEEVDVSCGCLKAEYPKREVTAGGEFVIRLTYDARQLGHFYKEACIYSNALHEPIYLSMQGVVVAETIDYYGQYTYSIGDLGVDLRDIEFDNVNKGDCPKATIHIVNQGRETLEPNMMHLPNYLSADISPKLLRPGKSGTIILTLNSSLIHDYGITVASLYLGNQLGETISPDNEITVSALLLPSLANATQHERLNPPHIKLSAENFNVKFAGKSKLTYKIDIENAGRSTLELSSFHLFTSALKMTLGKKSLAPGEHTTMKITVSRQESEEARTQPRVLMTTNDPDKPKVVISFDIKE